MVSNARTELGAKGALQDPPPRRRSSISDDLEPLGHWDAEEALLEDRIPLTTSDSSAHLGKSRLAGGKRPDLIRLQTNFYLAI